MTAPRRPEDADAVLVYGNATTIHRVLTDRDEPTPACRQHGENAFLKDPAVVVGHYTPCSRCFPQAAAGDGGEEADHAE